LKEEQEMLMHLADMALQIYALESAWLRTEKAKAKGNHDLRVKLCHIQAQRSAQVLRQAANEIAFALEDEALLQTLEALCRQAPQNIKTIRREVAKAMLDIGEYSL
jgi:F0F1-type ATP synthase membrane subunit b/b'